MITPLCIFLLAVGLTGVIPNEITNPQRLCDEYLTCLHELEVVQQECLQIHTQTGQSFDKPRNDNLLPTAVESGRPSKRDRKNCKKQRKKELHHELAQLHLQRIEALKECMVNSKQNAIIVTGSKTEKKTTTGKCLAASGKLKQILRRKASKNVKRIEGREKLKKSKGHRKTNKQACRRKAKVERKCHQMEKCCAVASSCKHGAMEINERIADLKRKMTTPMLECAHGNTTIARRKSHH